jgi:2-hydroxychromene-2-carboxylate isomerase
VSERLPDVEFFFDPVCPFAWITSRWVTRVAQLRDLHVEWRLICLRIVNEQRDYATLPDGYRSHHERGMRLLRIAAAARDRHGPAVLGPLYTAYGEAMWHVGPAAESARSIFDQVADDPAVMGPILESVGVDPALAAAAGEDRWDGALRAETELALARTGDEVGTPVITYAPPDGPSFFGPVISRIPDDDEALVLWDAVTTLARFPGFAELKRALRDPIDLPRLRRRDA